MSIATEDGSNYFEEEGSCLGDMVSYAPYSRISKSSSSSKSGGRKSISISSNTSSSSNNRIYWAPSKYWPYLAAALKNTRELDLSKDNNPSFGELMSETVPRQTV